MEEIREQLLLGMGFSEKAVSILDQELNMGKMENESIKAQHQGTCGDIMILHLKIEEKTITNAVYEYIGCAGLQACASAITEMVKGKSLDEAKIIEVEDIITYLGGIPLKKYECAEIARDTLRKATKAWENENIE